MKTTKQKEEELDNFYTRKWNIEQLENKVGQYDNLRAIVSWYDTFKLRRKDTLEIIEIVKIDGVWYIDLDDDVLEAGDFEDALELAA